MTEPQLPQPAAPNSDGTGVTPFGAPAGITPADMQWAPDGPQAVTDTAPRRAPLGSWRRVTALVGVVGLVGGGAFAARQFAAPSSNTPTQAVQQFLSALGTGDAIGAMETLAPGERDLMIDTAVPLVEELKRLDIIDPKNDLRKLDSAGIKFIGQAFAEQPVREDIATVQMTGGSVTMSADPSKLLGGVVKQFQDSLPQTQSKSEPFKEGSLTTVKRDGRWYVSLAYSAAEAARRSSGKPMPTLTESIAPAGAATPEAAVADMMNKLGALDLRGAISLMDPDEMQVLQDYGPLFLADAETSLSEARKFFTLTFPNLGLQSKQVDGRTVVSITKWSADVKVDFEGTKGQLLVDGECMTATYEGKQHKRCGDDIPKLVTDLNGESEQAKQLQEAWSNQSVVKAVRNPADTGSITVNQRNGKWYVSPLRTTFGSMVTSLKTVKPEDLKGTGKTPEERLTSLIENPLFGGVGSVFGGAIPGMGGDPSLGTPLGDDFSTLAEPDQAPSTDQTVVFDGSEIPSTEFISGEPVNPFDDPAFAAEFEAEMNRLKEITDSIPTNDSIPPSDSIPLPTLP